jgi:hypothetical protein
MLKHFLANHHFPAGTRVRCDFLAGDPFLQVLEEQGRIMERKLLLYYERSACSLKHSALLDFSPRPSEVLERARDVLSCLKDYSVEALQELLDGQWLCLFEAGSEFVAALHHQHVGVTSCEIVTFAVAEEPSPSRSRAWP